MDSMLPGQPAQPQSTQTHSNKNRVIFYFLGGVILLALIILASTFEYKHFQLSQRPKVAVTKQPSLTPSSKPKQQPITGLEVAKKVVLFLDKQITSAGNFNEVISCKAVNSCAPLVQEPLTNSYIILFYRELAQKTNDSSYKNKADKAVEFWTKKCEAATPTDKVCIRNIFSLAEYYKDSGNERYLKAIPINQVLTLPADTLQAEIDVHKTKKLATLYEITKDKKYLDQAETVVKALTADQVNNDKVNPPLYKEGDFTVREYSFDIVNFEYLPLYEITKDPTYLKAAEEILDRAKVTSHMEVLIAHNGKRWPILLDILNSLLDIARLDSSKSSDYTNQAHIIAQQLIDTFWDTPESKKFTGDFGFLGPISSWVGTKDTAVNGWLGSQFLKMADEKFKLVQ